MKKGKYDHLTIRKSDDYNTRKSKIAQRKLVKKKFKNKKDLLIIPNKSKIRYNEYVEVFCQRNHLGRWKNVGESVVKFSKELSLYNDPNKVLLTLLKMLYHAKNTHKPTTLVYGDQVSFGTLYLIDNLSWEIGQKRLWTINCQNISETEKIKLSNMRTVFSSSYESDSAEMINDRVHINRNDDSKANQSYRVKSMEITELIRKAIGVEMGIENFQLPFELHSAISSTIGEHFDNIILHTQAEYGVLCGFYDKELHEVSILIYNFGQTISDSLVKDNIPEVMKKDIERVIENLGKNNLFISKSFTYENALTLLAIQEGISSQLIYDRSRGHGLMDFIEHCFTLSEKTKIVIISGSTAIKIDSQYRIGLEDVFNRKRRILAFNAQNDIFSKPSEDHVINMDWFFNGVLIETTLPLK